MPWYNGDYPPSYKNQPELLRQKAVEIANELLLQGAEEGVAIATGLKRARQLSIKAKKTSGADRTKLNTLVLGHGIFFCQDDLKKKPKK